ncbi:MAG: hypothetical protein MJ223_04005 [Mycoplasmoidaceae bacterium]|nr:hypothetical protein [Mycoplasmoidaceae bacterium]
MFSIRSDVFDIETVIKGPVEVKKVFEDYKKRKGSKKPELKLEKKQEDLIPVFEVCLEMFARDINILNIDINKSAATDFIPQGNSILAPFSSLSGLGEEFAKSIVKARNERPFTSITDLQNRTKLSTTLIGKLKALGALSGLPDDEQMTLF